MYLDRGAQEYASACKDKSTCLNVPKSNPGTFKVKINTFRRPLQVFFLAHLSHGRPNFSL
jgi:hypothetical protein